jgi:glutamate-1-semialdehyde 2,1-aminomutase
MVFNTEGLTVNTTWMSLGAMATLAPAVYRRLQLSRAKHRSLAGHSLMAKRLARLLPGYHFDEQAFFKCDNAPVDIENLRKQAFYRIAATLKERHPLSLEASAAAREYISDMQFISAYRVPFQFSPLVQEHLKVGSFLQSSTGVTVTDLDGQSFYDLTGSYGVNVFGVDFYKKTMAQGMAKTQELGCVLGAYHPVVVGIAQRLTQLSGMDEVSFHMSGTEAVMQAVRLARYHTRRKRVVRFCGAYHGWWEDVQPGPGNPMPPRETFTLSDMSERSLEVLRTRKDIACVLINPLQAMHPNVNAPGDTTLIDSSRKAAYDRNSYTDWLKKLRQVCTDRGIVLIFDEVFLGFRLAAGGAQEYFGVRADMVTYGKTLGGGFPVGVVCGKKQWMQRFHSDRPADICFARGTFKEHPAVMGAMSAFLDQLETPEVKAIYEGLEERWNARCKLFNDTMTSQGLPVQAANMSSVWTVYYTQPSRYNWMLQYYLRLEGLALSWVGTGRMIFSLNYSDADFEAVLQKFVAAATRMKHDGWWWHTPELTNKSIRRSILKETFLR